MASGRGKFMRILHRMGMELSCKFGGPVWVNPEFLKLIQGVGSMDSPTHNQKGCVESGLGTLKLLPQFTLPGWSCAATYQVFVTSHSAEYQM
eukprot:1156351-Pelagomonas_calceolata.AAC.5